MYLIIRTFTLLAVINLFFSCNQTPKEKETPKPNIIYPKLDLFKSRSISGYVLTLHGPLHWQSKRQTITARSSAEAEIYATDKCIKLSQYVAYILQDLSLYEDIVPDTIDVYNDN